MSTSCNLRKIFDLPRRLSEGEIAVKFAMCIVSPVTVPLWMVYKMGRGIYKGGRYIARKASECSNPPMNDVVEPVVVKPSVVESVVVKPSVVESVVVEPVVVEPKGRGRIPKWISVLLPKPVLGMMNYAIGKCADYVDCIIQTIYNHRHFLWFIAMITVISIFCPVAFVGAIIVLACITWPLWRGLIDIQLVSNMN